MIKFQTIGLSSCRYDFSKSNAAGNQKTRLNYANTDTFVKQQEDISFSGFKKNKKVENRTEDNLASSLKHVSIKGMPFLLGVVTSAAVVKMGEGAAELLCDSDGYSVTEDGVVSDLVKIDTDNQILEFKGTGISINADDYDYVDWENGIFRNIDGSVDINLAEGKFIDTVNGIIVDPEHQVSGILDNGVMQAMAIPKFDNIEFGSGYPTGIVDDRWGTLQQEYARRNPEIYEQRNPFEKAADFIKSLFSEDSMPQVDGMEDIFGNEIITAKDSNGDMYLASYLQKEIDANPTFADFRMKFGKEAATERVNAERLEQYIQANHPSFGTRIMAYEGGRNATGGAGNYEELMESLEERHGAENKKGPGIFEEFDADKDGKLSPEELQNFMQSLSRDEKGNLDEEGTARFLELFDVNRDGKVTLDEIMEVFDLDKNGSVSFDEVFDFFDFNGDGVTTAGEFFRGIIKLIFRRD